MKLLQSLVFFLCLSQLAAAQSECTLPPLPLSPGNFLSEQQETDAGDIIAEQLERDFHVVPGDLNLRLQQVGEHLLAQAPRSELRFRFMLIDLPMVNAFAMPGGRIYVTRKLVAAAKSDDELAGVLGHEIGHGVARDPAVSFSNLLYKVLGVRQVGDKNDILTKYHQVVENIARRKVDLEDRAEEREQGAADRLAIYIIARAGYRPQAYTEFWDRITETRGKTGSWLTDFFGATRPESRRLRDMLKTAASLPPGCRRVAAPLAEPFLKWQSEVVAYSAPKRAEAVAGLSVKQTLDPPLRSDITSIRFSRDGKYLLAQDDASIYVLSRQPLAVLFRVDAKEAYPPAFAPEMNGFSFHYPSLRVERWDIPQQKRVDVREIAMRHACLQSALSPRGDLLACFYEGNLDVIDIAANQAAFQQKDFYVPTTFNDYVRLLLQRLLAEVGFETHYVTMGFTPDSRYLVAAAPNSNWLAWQTETHAKIPLPGSIRDLLGRSFDFQSSDRLVGVNTGDPKKSAIVRFPGGEPVTRLRLGDQDVLATASSDLILLKPIQEAALGVMDVNTGKIFMGNKTGALDAFGRTLATEGLAGEIILFDRDKNDATPLARLTLPRGPLGNARAFAVSDDFRYLALSLRSRGAIYDLATGQRLFHLRGFRGAHISEGMAWLDFPENDEQKRAIARLNLRTRQIEDFNDVGDVRASKYGRYFFEWKPNGNKEDFDKNITLSVKDAETMEVLWTRNFPKEAPEKYFDPDEDIAVFEWSLKSSHAKNELKNDPALAAKLAQVQDKEGAYLLHVVDSPSGKVLGKLLLDTGRGSFSVSFVCATPQKLVLSDKRNRVLVYDLATGQLLGRLFGDSVNVSRASGLLSLEPEDGKLALYDLGRLEKKREYTFPTAITRSRFSPDGKEMLVVTADQDIYLLDLSAPVQ